jgi:hypothetical protein
VQAPLPTPPTDNLYKFVALSGLILLLFVPVYYGGSYRDAARQSYAAETEFNVIDQERRFLAQEIFALYGGSKPPGELTEVEREALLKKSGEWQQKYRDWWLRDIRAKGLRRTIELLDQELRILRGVLALSLVVGSVFSLLGFRLWYQRVQRHQDLLLLSESKRAKELLEPPKTGTA